MGDILTINGVDLCNNAVNANNVILANILNVDAIPKDCVAAVCYTCGPLLFSFSEIFAGTCKIACEGACSIYYSKDYGTAFNGTPTGCTECNLQVGVPLYDDILCTAVTDGYYSPNLCSVGCPNKCYTVLGGIITSIGTCESPCTTCSPNTVSLTYATFCDAACDETICEDYFSNGNCLICPLMVGEYLYTDSSCTPALSGSYSTRNCLPSTPTCEVCYTVDIDGKILSVTTCSSIVPPCRVIKMTDTAFEFQQEACDDTSCVDRWTKVPVGQLIQTGDLIYEDSACVCAVAGTWYNSNGYYKVWYDDCGVTPPAPYYDQIIYKPTVVGCKVVGLGPCI